MSNGGDVVWESGPDGAQSSETGQASAAAEAWEATAALTPRSSYNWYYLRSVQGDADVIITSSIGVLGHY